MGVWGSGLYSSDFAKDLRASISAVSRLPYECRRLTEILCSVEAAASNESNNEDHTTFWLVVADQFEKRGVFCETARSKALHIIDTGRDLAVFKKLGMDDAGLRQREKVLSELRARLSSQSESSRRGPVLKKPQTFLMEIGDVFIYPTSAGRCVNPYCRAKEKIPGGWKADSWAAALIVDRGRAFDFLTWYRPLTISSSLPDRPQLDSLHSMATWILRKPGTCSALHFKRMELEKIASLSIDGKRAQRAFGSMKEGAYQAVNDISIANELRVAPAINFHASFHPYRMISSLTELL